MTDAPTRPRTAARVAAVQALFQSEQGPENPETVIDQFVRHRFGPGDFENGAVPDAHAKLFGRIVRAASEKQADIDTHLAETLPPEWPLARLDPVLRALLRAGAAELITKDGAPAKVVINEYLDVAHGFFDGDEPRMANGLLDKIARSLRPKEF
ncbi:MAG TPA: transcription antitermination factor NusB [Acetobacteraceae bacterium]|nr:transcription antitermination factor NusB [Acetobacteraceae bacterium]